MLQETEPSSAKIGRAWRLNVLCSSKGLLSNRLKANPDKVLTNGLGTSQRRRKIGGYKKGKQAFGRCRGGRGWG